MAVKFEILNKPLFVRKLALVTISMALLVPLVMLQTRVPAIIYVLALLIIHVLVLILYLYKVEWRRFSKTGLVVRALSVIIFSYLLSKVRFAPGPEVLYSIAITFVLHVLILLILMVKIEVRKAPSSPAQS